MGIVPEVEEEGVKLGEKVCSGLDPPVKAAMPLPKRCKSLTAALVLAPEPIGPSKLGTIDVSGSE